MANLLLLNITSGGCERLFQITNDILRRFQSDRKPNQAIADAKVAAQLRIQIGVRC
jgi:hypothetical protein